MNRILFAGDSTVTFNKIGSYPQTGLSQGLTWYLKDSVFLKSFAVNGRSTKSFIDEGRLDLIDKELETGDVLLIEFGHNDEKANDPSRYAEAFTDYEFNIQKMVEVARKHEAFPVVITSVARRTFDESGQFRPGSHGDYPKAAREISKKLDVPCIDLCRMSEEYLASMGDFASRPMYMYPKDNSHLSVHGAVIFAGFIADGLMELGSPYKDLLVPRTSNTFDDNLGEANVPYIVRAKGEVKDGSDAFKDEGAN
ncbi:MAG: rhamnogalacturonan acetylesterase [Lachnospiraceae bacterium]|nr:rhamnogalacturonan acetylesterase [Lachnospiraceae bacterium]